MSQKSAKQNRKAQELEALLNQSEERCAILESENKELRQKMDRLTEQFLNAQRAQFSQSSEKAEYVMADQMRLFNEAEASEDAKPEEVTVSAQKRAKKTEAYLGRIKENASEARGHTGYSGRKTCLYEVRRQAESDWEEVSSYRACSYSCQDGACGLLHENIRLRGL